MSTKTTFKRVALVTVAAMGFGLLSVAPSNAVPQSDTLTLTSATTTWATGSSATLTNNITQGFLGVNGDTMSVSMTLTSAPTGNAVMPVFAGSAAGSNAQTNVNVPVVTTDGLQFSYSDTAVSSTTYALASAKMGINFTPTLPGTYVITFTAYNNSAMTAAEQLVAATVTSKRLATTQPAVATPVTWTVVIPSGSVADSTTTSITNAYGVATGSADISVRIAAGSSTAGAATVVVTPLVDAAATTGSTVVTATVSGPGTLLVNATSTGGTSSGFKTHTLASGTAATPVYVHLFADGTSGTSTITITVGGATKTETVTFYGAAASVTSTLVIPVIQTGSTATAGVITAVVKDAAGNVVPGKAMFAVSGTTTVMASSTATTGSSGIATFSFTGLTAGTSAITVQNVAAGSTATYSAAALSVRSGDAEGASVVISLDKATYAQGEAAVVTVTVKDAAGNLVADGTNTPFAAAAVCSRACTGTLPGTSHVTSGSHAGAITYAINVPSTSGAFTVSATAGSGWTGTFSASATVSLSAAETAAAAAIAAAADIASAAVDAAAEATDAANAATDAANAAAEAADAATAAAQDAADAVASLATAVTELMADLKAQIAAQKAAITALTNLVIKIQKKIKA